MNEFWLIVIIVGAISLCAGIALGVMIVKIKSDVDRLKKFTSSRYKWDEEK